MAQEAALMRACDDAPGTITSGEEVDARFFLKYILKWKKAGNSNDCKEHKTSSICFLVSFLFLVRFFFSFSCLLFFQS